MRVPCDWRILQSTEKSVTYSGRMFIAFTSNFCLFAYTREMKRKMPRLKVCYFMAIASKDKNIECIKAFTY